METVLQYLSSNIRNEIIKYIEENNTEDIEEIRIRAQRPLVLKIGNKNKITKHIISIEEMLETFQKVCENSVYSYQKQICEGYITIRGGHRVGITGECVFENGQVINIRHISSLNIRIAREKYECSKEIFKYIIDENYNIFNTLIVSKPGCGKTTMLRDLIRKISEEKTCGVVDERGEIGAMYRGIPQNNVGILTDIVDNISKSKGMTMLIRSMAPQVIACDEIGSKEDIEAINYAICSGVKGIFTAHGGNIEELLLNPQLSSLLQKNIIQRIIFLDSNNKGKIEKVYKLDKTSSKNMYSEYI